MNLRFPLPAITIAVGAALLLSAGTAVAQEHGPHAAEACTPEHAAMGHCRLPQTGQHDTEHHPTGDAHRECTPEHAARGHCRPSAAPRTPVPAVTDEDRAAAFPALASDGMAHPSGISSMLDVERLEGWDSHQGSGQFWRTEAWLGGDTHRLWLRSEGRRSGGGTADAELEVLYGRSVSPWWDLLAGVRQDTRPASRTWAALGVEGLAPYMIDVTAMAHVGSGGQVQLSAQFEYDIRFSNRLVLQPDLEVEAALRSQPAHGIGSGLNTVTAGLRLRYEIHRQFAPYLGIEHERALGRTADHARADGDPARETRVVGGVRFWF